MKIVHLCLGSFYVDGYSYQENLLPKYHKRLGYDVEIIASTMSFDKNGKMSFLENADTYKNEYGIKVERLAYKRPLKIFRKLKSYIGLYNALENSNPDVLFIHGLQFLDMKIVVKYLKKHRNIKVYVDNHCDENNSAKNILSKYILHKFLWRRSACMIEPFTTKFYGVLPVRVDFLVNYYKLPREKCELLIMGADDDLVEKYKCNVDKIRNELNISASKFVIVTGGKIDSNKPEVLNLMKAVKNISSDDVSLYVFGTVSVDLKERFDSLIDDKYVNFLGWADVEKSYKYFSMSDVVCFPGLHSVYWEQVVALGKPMICRKLKGTQHINYNDNVVYLSFSSVEEIQNLLLDLLENNKAKFKKLQNNISDSRKDFLYSEIAKKSISD